MKKIGGPESPLCFENCVESVEQSIKTYPETLLLDLFASQSTQVLFDILISPSPNTQPLLLPEVSKQGKCIMHWLACKNDQSTSCLDILMTIEVNVQESHSPSASQSTAASSCVLERSPASRKEYYSTSSRPVDYHPSWDKLSLPSLKSAANGSSVSHWEPVMVARSLPLQFDSGAGSQEQQQSIVSVQVLARESVGLLYRHYRLHESNSKPESILTILDVT